MCAKIAFSEEVKISSLRNKYLWSDRKKSVLIKVKCTCVCQNLNLKVLFWPWNRIILIASKKNLDCFEKILISSKTILIGSKNLDRFKEKSWLPWKNLGWFQEKSWSLWRKILIVRKILIASKKNLDRFKKSWSV